MSRVETVEEFLARGGQIEPVPRGAMAEAGWTPSQMMRVAATGNTGQGTAKPPTLPEDVPVTGVHRIPNQAAGKTPKAPKAPKPPKPPKPKLAPRPKREKAQKPSPGPYANRNGADGTKTVALLEALAGGWRRVGEIVKATGQAPSVVCARLTQLRERGAVISHGERPYTQWALPGTAAPDDRSVQGVEFEGLTDLQLLAKVHETREQVRAAQRLIVRIEREIVFRSKQEQRRRNACR
jgi:hypothetical protein